MSTFGSDYKKNDLYDSIQEFFKQGGSVEDMLDVLHVAFKWGDTEIDTLKKRIEELSRDNMMLRSTVEKLTKQPYTYGIRMTGGNDDTTK